MLSLNNKHIILGITGGIAAYKSAELCRLLIKAGAQVRVVMTQAAQEFITPLTMQSLSGNRVHTHLLDSEAEAAMGHIELARWADLILVAPASANFMAQLAHGEARDLLATLCVTSRSPLAIAPAMNQAMWSNTATQQNLHTLRQNGIHIFGPDSGAQACGDIGLGRMQEPQQLAEQAAALFETGALAGLRVLITAGPTREAVDPVRFISNHSSGKMGYAIARAAVEAGAQVTLVSGPTHLEPPAGVNFIAIESALQMLAACQAHAADVFIGVAAVADYRPAQAAQQKIKKADETLSLELIRNPDILATIATSKPRPFCVGFAAETENLASNATSKLQHKNLDMVIANDAAATFGQDHAGALALWHGGEETLPPQSKEQLARRIIELIAIRMQAA
jgi:phosphopantothenoylcysteine decarboxylase / phosphopantothenate---cysteine ligase